MSTTGRTLRIGHSPDPDDAFMWWPLANFSMPDGTRLSPQIDTRGYVFEHVLEDIQSLNERSARGELEVTALSIHQYPYVADRYVLTSCGASMGDGYGPMLVTRSVAHERDLVVPVTTPGKSEPTGLNHKVAIPGKRTSAWLALQLYMLEQEGVQVEGDTEQGQAGPNRSMEYVVVPFDQIIPRVASGEFAAGLIIHEGQLTYGDAGLRCLVDLGAWWKQTRGLPLPLGGNAIRRDVGSAEELQRITGVLLESIRHALDHRDEAVAFALNYARDMGRDLADRFVGMYVNDWTLDYGDAGRRAVMQFLKEAEAASLIPPVPGDPPMFVSPG
jgi:1,4-dihydroxy-6-naphthoate synthase